MKFFPMDLPLMKRCPKCNPVETENALAFCRIDGTLLVDEVNENVTTTFSLLGEKDKAFAELQESFAQHDWWLYRLNVDPFMDSLRDDARFQAILKTPNFPE